jgi:hypothetical protein
MGFNLVFEGLNESFTSSFQTRRVIKQGNVAGKYIPAVKECVGVKGEIHAFLT